MPVISSSVQIPAAVTLSECEFWEIPQDAPNVAAQCGEFEIIKNDSEKIGVIFSEMYR